MFFVKIHLSAKAESILFTIWINVGALSEALNDKADRSELQKITQELNTKADLDMNNIPSATLSAKIAPLLESLGGSGGIVEQGERDTGGYCLWDNGLLVQWISTNIDSNQINTITFFKTYKDTKYIAMSNGITNCDLTTRTVSSIKTTSASGYGSTGPLNVLCIGWTPLTT